MPVMSPVPVMRGGTAGIKRLREIEERYGELMGCGHMDTNCQDTTTEKASLPYKKNFRSSQHVQERGGMETRCSREKTVAVENGATGLAIIRGNEGSKGGRRELTIRNAEVRCSVPTGRILTRRISRKTCLKRPQGSWSGVSEKAMSEML